MLPFDYSFLYKRQSFLSLSATCLLKFFIAKDKWKSEDTEFDILSL